MNVQPARTSDNTSQNRRPKTFRERTYVAHFSIVYDSLTHSLVPAEFGRWKYVDVADILLVSQQQKA